MWYNTTQSFQLVLLLCLACTLCRGSQRALLQGVLTSASADPAAAIQPDVIRCRFMPPAPEGYIYANWTAKWPQSCLGTPVGDPCVATCNPGFQAIPYPPRIYCLPARQNRWGKWDETTFPTGCTPITPKPVKCRGAPNYVAHFSWPTNCSRSTGANCTAVCDSGYSGDPTPTATCVLAPSGGYAQWVVDKDGICKDNTTCRDNPCRDVAYAIPTSCVPSPDNTDYTCTCFDYYRWDGQAKICKQADLHAFSVAAPADDKTQKSYIYKYAARKATDIGGARWLVQDNGSNDANLYGVAIADSTTAWAVGAKGLIKKYNGQTWNIDQPGDPNAEDLLAVATVSKNKAWVGGKNGAALYWDGTKWTDVSVNKGRDINAISAVTVPGTGDIVWAVAGDERDLNNLNGYIYRWQASTKAWVTQPDWRFGNLTLRGVSVLDAKGAWAVGYTSKGPVAERAVVLVWDSASSTWTRDVVQLFVNGYARLNDIVAVDYQHIYAAGYYETADQASGSTAQGLVVQYDGKQWGLRYYGGQVEKFNGIAGLSPSTTVAVGYFKDETALNNNWGYPAENWQKRNFQDMQQKNNSIALNLAVTGIGMKYLEV